MGDGACLSMMYWKARREETIQCQPKILSMRGKSTNVPGIRPEPEVKKLSIKDGYNLTPSPWLSFCPAVIDESVEHAVSEPALKDSQMN